MKIVMMVALALSACAMAGCNTAPMAAPPAAAMAPPPVPGTGGETKVGPGSKAGFCTFKDASGKLFEAKCK